MDLVAGFSNGIALGIIPYFLGFLNIRSDIFLWITMIFVSYGLAVAINSIIQLTSCGRLDIKRVAMLSTFLPFFVLIFLGISYIGFLSWAIVGLLPSEMDSNTKQLISRGYWIFWGAFYGQVLAGGFAQSCN